MRITAVILNELIQSPLIHNIAAPTLFHADLHKRNIFVSEEDPTKIISLIDWQSTSIEPTFVYANETPDIAARPDCLSAETGDATKERIHK